jgi:hypothetical protein
MARNGIWSAIALASVWVLSGSNASAAWLSFTAHLQANTGEFRITNLSDDGFELTGLSLQLGDGAGFDTSVLDLGTLIDGGTALTFTPLADAVVHGAASAVFQFGGFETSDEFGFKTKFVDLLNGGNAAGSDFNHALLIATLPTTPSSSRRAFVFTGSAEAEPPVHHPEPGSLVLLALGVASVGAYQLRCRRRSTVDVQPRSLEHA